MANCSFLVEGGMAERLRTGLQIRVHRFESGYHLQIYSLAEAQKTVNH